MSRRLTLRDLQGLVAQPPIIGHTLASRETAVRGGVRVLIGKLFKTLLGVGSHRNTRSAEATHNPSAEAPQRQWISNPWHAVAVVPCTAACQLARQSSHLRFLSREAPALPLAGCHMRSCTCRYRHFQDRRSSPRRDSDEVGSQVDWAGLERRRAPGRRSSD